MNSYKALKTVPDAEQVLNKYYPLIIIPLVA